MLSRFVIRYDKQVHRFLEIVPGVLTWLVILSPAWLGLIYPPAIVYLITLLTVYWCYLALRGTIGGFKGYARYKREIQVDWGDEVKKLDFSNLPDKATLPNTLGDIRHFILIPVVNEPLDVLTPTIEALLRQTFSPKQIVVAFTAEEKYAKQVKETIYQAFNGRETQLDELLFYVHPAGVPGEAIGAAAANRTSGGKQAVQHLKDTGRNLRNFIFTTIDCDHVLHDQYIARLTHLYLSSDKRDNRYYSSAMYTFNNNNWEVPTMMRIEANFVTLGTLSDWGHVSGGYSGTKDSFACYSTSLITLIEADFWDPSLGVDDTIFYWRAFFVRNGDFVGTPHYIPFSADAVGGRTTLEAYRSMYKQLVRWGYGVIDFPLSIKGFMTNKNIPFNKKLSWVIKHIHKRVILVNTVFIITFGFGIATFVNPDIKQTSFAYSLPIMMSIILTFTMIFLIPGTVLRHKIAKSIPQNWPLWKKVFAYLEGPLVIINLLTYSFIPYVDAQTRLMLGKKMKDLYHTPKVR